MIDEFPKKSTSGTSVNGVASLEKETPLQTIYFLGFHDSFRERSWWLFLPPNFSKKQKKTAQLSKWIVFPPNIRGTVLSITTTMFTEKPSSLYFTYMSFSDRFVDPSMASEVCMQKIPTITKPQQLETTYWNNPVEKYATVKLDHLCRDRRESKKGFKPPPRNRGHHITNPNKAQLCGKLLEITIHLHCLIPPKVGDLLTPYQPNKTLSQKQKPHVWAVQGAEIPY